MEKEKGIAMSASFNLVFEGSFLDGFEKDTVKKNLMQLFALPEDAAEKVLATPGMVLKKNLSEDECKTYLEALNEAGIKAEKKSIGGEPDSGGDDVEMEAMDDIQNDFASELEAEEGDSSVFMDEEDESDFPALEEGGEDDFPSLAEEDGDFPAIPMETEEEPGEYEDGVLSSFQFKGKGSEYFGIWIVNILLSVITLGIYSAWAKVRRRRYIYGNTVLNGASFEYLADPKKILKGRIIVAVFLGAYAALREFFPIYSLGFIPVFIILLPWLVNRSMTFNNRNTAHRNIRFGFNATYMQAAKAFLLWPLFGVLTFGIMIPFALLKQKAFLVGHSSYGTTRFQFNATAGDYYELVFKTVLVVLIGAGVGAAAFYFAIMGSAYMVYGLIGIYVFAFLVYFYVFSFYQARQTNLLVGSTTLKQHQMTARLKANRFFWIVLSNTLLLAITAGIFYPWSVIRTIRYKINQLGLIPQGDINQFIADEEQSSSALGEEASDLFDIDIGL